MKKLNLKEAKCYELERIFFFKINKGIIKVLKVLLKVKKKKTIHISVANQKTKKRNLNRTGIIIYPVLTNFNLKLEKVLTLFFKKNSEKLIE